MSTTIVNNEDITSVFIKTLNNKKGTIVDVAKGLNITIAEASKYVTQLSNKNEKLEEIFRKRKWPQDITSGYIFIGGGPLKCKGEREGLLMPGQHVFASILPNRDKAKRNKYAELALSVLVYEKEYDIMRISKNAEGQLIWKKADSSCWFIDEGRSIQELKEFLDDGKAYDKRIMLRPTGKERINYKQDKWLGSVYRTDIVGVNYDWL